MKIGMLYIGIGKYYAFWEKFYETSMQNFVPGSEKQYFLVTDQDVDVPANVMKIYQEDLGWPCNTWFRFMFFLRKKEELAKCDYLFFFNANSVIKVLVTAEEILPTEEEGGLLMLTWQAKDTPFDEMPYERRPESSAYVPLGTKQRYYQGTLNGGLAKEFIPLMEKCNEYAFADFSNGLVTRAHDESDINKYMLGRKCKIVESIYGRPEHRDKDHSAKIVFIDKDKVLGHRYMKGLKRRQSSSLIGRVKRIIFGKGKKRYN